MRAFTAVVEKCPDTGLYIGYVPGFPGAHTQAASLDELQVNLREVIATNTGFAAFSYGNDVIVSDNGTDWTLHDIGMPGYARDVI